MRPLSTPGRPPLELQSDVVTPGQSLPSASRIGTTKQCTPWFSPPVISCANTAATLAVSAAPPM